MHAPLLVPALLISTLFSIVLANSVAAPTEEQGHDSGCYAGAEGPARQKCKACEDVTLDIMHTLTMDPKELETTTSIAAPALECKPHDKWTYTCVPNGKKPILPTDCSELCRCDDNSSPSISCNSGDTGCELQDIKTVCEKLGGCACRKRSATETVSESGIAKAMRSTVPCIICSPDSPLIREPYKCADNDLTFKACLELCKCDDAGGFVCESGGTGFSAETVESTCRSRGICRCWRCPPENLSKSWYSEL